MREKAAKNILFTFDYELFLGKESGNVFKCVLQPTNKLLAIFNEYKIENAIFFVDTLWLVRLKAVAKDSAFARKDYDAVTEQLKQILKNGHYIFPHLHPHWLDAVYLKDKNQWQMINFSRYRLHNVDKPEREKCFDDSVTLLKEILGDDYKPIAYRAGGWSIQPFEDFAPLFQKHNVLYDFSVMPGAKLISAEQLYDFSDIEISTPYKFSTDVTVPGNGAYTEFPINMLFIPMLYEQINRLLLKYLWWTGNRSFGDGKSIVSIGLPATKNKEMASIELLNRVKLPLYLRYVKHNDYMQLISHPKMLTEHNLDAFGSFLNKLKNRYNLNTDFKKIVL